MSSNCKVANDIASYFLYSWWMWPLLKVVSYQYILADQYHQCSCMYLKNLKLSLFYYLSVKLLAIISKNNLLSRDVAIARSYFLYLPYL